VRDYVAEDNIVIKKINLELLKGEIEQEEKRVHETFFFSLNSTNFYKNFTSGSLCILFSIL